MRRSPRTRSAPRPEPGFGVRSAYLGADRAGTEFWLSDPHVFALSSNGSRLRRVYALARFNRRGRSRGRGARPAAEDLLTGLSHS